MKPLTVLLDRLFASRAPWQRPGHFAKGDGVVFGPNDPCVGTVAWQRRDQIGVHYSTERSFDGEGVLRAIAPRGDVRHDDDCAPCLRDLADQAAEQQEAEQTYWAQWPLADREAHRAALADMVDLPDYKLAFGPNTAIPMWLRAEFDGRMQPSESPSLALARVAEPADWDRIIREHPEFRVESPWEHEGLARPGGVVAAYELLREHGVKPWLDVTLEMELDATGAIEIYAEVTSLSAELPLDDQALEQASALMGREPNQWPMSCLRWPAKPDGPGTDRSRPYKSSTIEQTSWDW